MKFLLLILVFDVSNDGMRVVDQETRLFVTKVACEAEGERLAKTTNYPGQNLRSMSICIPQSAFEE